MSALFRWKSIAYLAFVAVLSLGWTAACTKTQPQEQTPQEKSTTEPSTEPAKTDAADKEPAKEPANKEPAKEKKAEPPTDDASDASVNEPTTEPGTPDSKNCIGVRPPEDAWKDGGTSPSPVPPLPDSTPREGDACTKSPGTCIDKSWPIWKLRDFQPQSCGYKGIYGLPVFKGKVTVVVLLSAWCSYCQGQAEKLEKMRLEMEIAKKQLHIVVVNSIDAKDDQKKLVDRCSFPLFQDNASMEAWKRHDGGKDDFYIYDKDGKLKHYFSSSDPNINTDLSTTEGYKFLKDTLLKLLK